MANMKKTTAYSTLNTIEVSW